MKKIKILLLLLLIPLICSCAKKNYDLIQITGAELVQNLLYEDKNFIFAIIDESESNAAEFKKTLKGISKSANINIYYVDYLHLTQEDAFELFNSYSTDFTTNGYHVVQNKSLIVSAAYIDYKTTYTTLKTKSYTNELVRIDNKTKKKAIEEAKKLYKENKIAEAHEKLCTSWDLKEAQEEHKNNKYYNLINSWERTEYTLDIPERVNYTSFIFNSGVNYYIEQKVSDLSEDFEKPTTLENYNVIYYRVENDIIYTSNREKGYYEKKYKINDVDDKYLQITDIKTNKKYTYSRRGNL